MAPGLQREIGKARGCENLRNSGQIESLLDLKTSLNRTSPPSKTEASLGPCLPIESKALQSVLCFPGDVFNVSPFRLQLHEGAKSACRFGRAGARAARSAPTADERSPRMQMAHSTSAVKLNRDSDAIGRNSKARVLAARAHHQVVTLATCSVCGTAQQLRRDKG